MRAGHGIEQAILGKTPHHQHPVDRLAMTERQSSVRLAADRFDAPIKCGGGAPVKRQFGLADGLALCRGGKVEIGQADRALELVRA